MNKIAIHTETPEQFAEVYPLLCGHSPVGDRDYTAFGSQTVIYADKRGFGDSSMARDKGYRIIPAAAFLAMTAMQRHDLLTRATTRWDEYPDDSRHSLSLWLQRLGRRRLTTFWARVLSILIRLGLAGTMGAAVYFTLYHHLSRI